jgi:hypothetical protein
MLFRLILPFEQIKDLGVRDFYTGEAVTTSNGSGFIVKVNPD